MSPRQPISGCHGVEMSVLLVVTRNTLCFFSSASLGDTLGAKEEYRFSHQSEIGAGQSRETAAM